jgi:hypothetical protein
MVPFGSIIEDVVTMPPLWIQNDTKHQQIDNHWIGLREKIQETPIFNGKNHGFL